MVPYRGWDMAQDVSSRECWSLKSAVSVVEQAILAATILTNAAASNVRGQDLVPAPPNFQPSKPQVGESVIPDLVRVSPPGFMDDPPTTRSTRFMDVDGGELIFDPPAIATSNRIREIEDGTRRAFAHLQRACEHLRGQANALALAECEKCARMQPRYSRRTAVRSQVFRALNRYDDAGRSRIRYSSRTGQRRRLDPAGELPSRASLDRQQWICRRCKKRGIRSSSARTGRTGSTRIPRRDRRNRRGRQRCHR